MTIEEQIQKSISMASIPPVSVVSLLPRLYSRPLGLWRAEKTLGSPGPRTRDVRDSQRFLVLISFLYMPPGRDSRRNRRNGRHRQGQRRPAEHEADACPGVEEQRGPGKRKQKTAGQDTEPGGRVREGEEQKQRGRKLRRRSKRGRREGI